jgi:hypothetical protein
MGNKSSSPANPVTLSVPADSTTSERPIMKKLAIALSLFAAFGAANADTIFRATNDAGGTINLTDNSAASCRNGYQVAYSTLPNMRNAAPLRGCWKAIDYNFHVIWSDGVERMFPMSGFDLTEYANRTYDTNGNRRTGNGV